MSYATLKRHHRWLPVQLVYSPRVPEKMKPWLLSSDSLTSQLIDLSNDHFRVRVLRQYQARALWHEQVKEGIAQHLASTVREVELLLFEKPVVFARSIIPIDVNRRAEQKFRNLGNKPLGHLLFKHGRARMARREIAHMEHQDATIWARRTPYIYDGSSILVSEYFLPSFNRLIAEN